MIAAGIAGALAGVVSALMLAFINDLLRAGTPVMRTRIVLFFGLCVLRLISGLMSGVLLVRLTHRAIADLRVHLCRQILYIPLRRFEELGSHRLMAALTDDVRDVTEVVINLPYFSINLVIVFSCILYLGWLSMRMMLIMCACLIIGMLTYQIPVFIARSYLHKARDHQDTLFGHFNALLSGFKELKLNYHKRESFMSRVLEPATIAVERAIVAGTGIYTTVSNWNRLLFFIYVGILLFASQAVAPLNPATIASYVLVVLYMMAPLEAIMNSFPNIARAQVSLAKIEALGLALSCDDTREPLIDHNSLPTRGPEFVRLTDVVHTYRRVRDGSTFAIGPINLQLARGELVFVVGGNGSGKTTLVKLIAGLYQPEHGTILLDGKAITPEARDAYRQHFSAIFADFHLFQGLLDVRGAYRDEEITEHLRKFQLDHCVSVSNGQLSTTEELSRGQRKRLALLAALLEDRPFYLFDEWAADQDPSYKAHFYFHILPSLKAQGKGLLVVSHDDRFYHIADRLIHLEDGLIKDADPGDPTARLTVFGHHI
jgi:putative ATP-binding cassette transporter